MHLNNSDSLINIGDMINSPMETGDEKIVPWDIECSCNMVSSIWSIEGKTY